MKGSTSTNHRNRKNSGTIRITEDPSTKLKKVTMQVFRASKKTQPQTHVPHDYFQNLQLKDLIKQLKQRGGIQRDKLLKLLDKCQNIFKNEPNILRVTSPVVIVGDIHGQFFDLVNIFEINGFPSDKKFLFLGDYVDRGLFCVEVVTLLLVLKVKYEKNMNLLRGNHEGRIMTMNFNFRLQCQKKYGIEIYERFMDVFCKLPLCSVINDTYFAVHGGISPQIQEISQLQKIHRFIEIQNKGIICDLLWSDPSQTNTLHWQMNAMRGCSYYYGKIQAKKFLKDNHFKLIIRGHEVQLEGFNYQKSNNEEKLTLTIFSAPNYCDTYRNKAAVACINQNKISINRFHDVAHPFVLSNYMDGLEFTIPGICKFAGKLFLYLLKSKPKSKKTSIVDDQILAELNALKRIESITKSFQQKFFQHEEIFLQNDQKKNDSYPDLEKSYQIALQLFLEKKTCDDEEKYPDEATKIIKKQRRESRKQEARLSHKFLTSFSLGIEQKEVFGPKLDMKNNFYRKQFLEDEGVIGLTQSM